MQTPFLNDRTFALTAREVAQYLRVSKVTVCRWFSEGKLPGFRIGREWRMRHDDLHRLLGDAHRTTLEDLVAHYAEHGHPLDRMRRRMERYSDEQKA